MRTRHLSLEGLFHLHWSIIHAQVENADLKDVFCSRSDYKGLPWCFRELVDNRIDPAYFDAPFPEDDPEAQRPYLERKNLHLTEFIREDSKFRLHPLVFMVNDSSQLRQLRGLRDISTMKSGIHFRMVFWMRRRRLAIAIFSRQPSAQRPSHVFSILT